MVMIWSMRPWESARQPVEVGRGSDSQGRMDQIMTMATEGKESVTAGDLQLVGGTHEVPRRIAIVEIRNGQSPVGLVCIGRHLDDGIAGRRPYNQVGSRFPAWNTRQESNA